MTSLFSCFGPRKPATPAVDENGNEISPNEKPGSSHTTPSAPAAPQRPAWEALLPKPAADAALGAAISSVFDSIDAYVEKYYRDKTSEDLDATHEACLMLVGTPHLPSSLIDLLQSNRPNPLVCRPTALIKHSIAYMVQQAMTMDEGGRNSLLPPWMTSLPQALKGAEHDDEAAFSEAFAHWRVLTAHLQPPNATTTNPLAKQSRTQATRAIADRITGAFSPWESFPGSPEQRADLVAICDEAAAAGALVFAQPAAFAFVWTPQNLGLDEEPRKVAVVKPGVVKTCVGGDGAMERKGEEVVVVHARHVPLTFPEGFVAQ
ncbi:uncharacterized protein BKCO1_4100041 [Diplodia corticola]|uniref:Uncharacterized protein n=1 Tax=Diplodia corticola TaxID=236234 RepID=A0A1J9RUL5_9PEZI|nr:uncharacterized protein BKCO1_4100041 [Diplodia corticola]OJD32119.1 hypothetical protein BKCO1_4100041 [Diplodia corticola]